VPDPPDGPASVRSSAGAARKRVLRAETIGIIVIALIIFVVTVLRYRAHINWSAR
jgi:hypothetical protein